MSYKKMYNSSLCRYQFIDEKLVFETIKSLDLRNVCNWLKANKISLSANKTELIIFRHPPKR